MSSQYSSVPDRPLNELYEQSLHPLMLALPPAFTWWGAAGNDLLVSLEPRSAGTNLYVGVTTIIVALLGLYYLLLQPYKMTKREQLVGIFGFSIVGVSFLFSLAPSIALLGFDVPMPSNVIATYVPALRAGQRLVMPIMIGLLILASIAIAHFDRSWVTKSRTKIGVFLIFMVVVAVDISIKVPELTGPVPQPEIAYKLRDAPPGIVAQYINGSLTGDPSQIACKLYMIHRKPIINYCGLEIFYPKGELQTVHQLSRMPLENQMIEFEKYGVRYIIVQNDDPTDLEFFNRNQSLYGFAFGDDTYSVFMKK